MIYKGSWRNALYVFLVMKSTHKASVSYNACQIRKMTNSHGRTWNMARNTEKRAKWETHSVGSGIWLETVKNVKYKKYTLCDLDLARKLKNVENETQTLYDLEYCEKHWKTLKLEMDSIGPGLWRENWKTCKMRHTL